MYVCAWLEHRPPTIHEVLRIEAATRAELLAGIASALRKGKIQRSHEMAILRYPPGEATALRGEVEQLMAATRRTE